MYWFFGRDLEDLSRDEPADLKACAYPLAQSIEISLAVFGRSEASPHGALLRRWKRLRPDSAHVHFMEYCHSQLTGDDSRATRELESAIRSYVALSNEQPRPFVWTKTADQILHSLARFVTRISDSGH